MQFQRVWDSWVIFPTTAEAVKAAVSREPHHPSLPPVTISLHFWHPTASDAFFSKSPLQQDSDTCYYLVTVLKASRISSALLLDKCYYRNIEPLPDFFCHLNVLCDNDRTTHQLTKASSHYPRLHIQYWVTGSLSHQTEVREHLGLDPSSLQETVERLYNSLTSVFLEHEEAQPQRWRTKALQMGYAVLHWSSASPTGPLCIPNVDCVLSFKAIDYLP